MWETLALETMKMVLALALALALAPMQERAQECPSLCRRTSQMLLPLLMHHLQRRWQSSHHPLSLNLFSVPSQSCRVLKPTRVSSLLLSLATRLVSYQRSRSCL